MRSFVGIAWPLPPHSNRRSAALPDGCARDPFVKQVWTTIGRCDRIKIEASREKAREIIRRVKAGKPAFEPEPPKADTLAAVVADWLALYVGPERAADATRDRAPPQQRRSRYGPRWPHLQSCGIRPTPCG